MKRFRFRLERLLKVKRHRELLAQQRQQQARMVFELAAQDVARAEARLEEAGGGGIEALRRAVTLGAWQARYEQVVAIEQGLVALREVRERAWQQLLEAEKARVEIAAEVEALNHLRKSQLEAYEEEAAHRTQRTLDEVGVRRWVAGREGEKESGEMVR